MMRRCSTQVPSEKATVRSLTLLNWAWLTNSVAERSFVIPDYNLSFSEEINYEESFCHFGSLTKYPYDQMGPAFRKKVNLTYRQLRWWSWCDEQVAQNCFEKGLIYERTWDLWVLPSRSFPSLSTARPSTLELDCCIANTQFDHPGGINFTDSSCCLTASTFIHHMSSAITLFYLFQPSK